jgi:hypothetical protein
VATDDFAADNGLISDDSDDEHLTFDDYDSEEDEEVESVARTLPR